MTPVRQDQSNTAIDTEKNNQRRYRRKQRFFQGLTILSPILILLLWEGLSRSAIIDPRFFPPPTSILGSFYGMLLSGLWFHEVGVSLYRIIGGFLLGTIPAICLGLFMGLYKPVRYFIQPLVMTLMPIPTLALLPLIIIIFGIGEFSKMVTIALSVFFPVVINTTAGVINIEKIYIDVAKNYGAKHLRFFKNIAFPGALPVMMEGIQMGQAIALLTVVAAEMIGAQSGIGYLIWSSYQTFNLEPMYVGLISISFFGYLFSLALRWLQKKLIPWQK